MKFTIATQEFNYLVTKCLGLIPTKPPVPILSSFLIEASKGMLTMTATDLSVSIRCMAETSIQEEGSTTLPAKSLSQLVRELTSANLQLATGANEVMEIVADGSKFRLHGMSGTEYPEFPELKDAVSFSMKQTALKDVLFRTAFAVSRDPSRFVLNGVFLGIANGYATFAGTDGKRLAKTFLPIRIDSSFTGNYVIPLKAIEEAQKNLNDEDGEAKIYLMDDKIAIETPDAILVAKLLSGDYPDISRVIPASTDLTIPLHREELMTILRQVALFTMQEESQAARFLFSNGEMQLEAADRKLGDGKVGMPVNYEGPNFEIAFNPGFFLDILRHTKTERVSLGLTDPYNPGIITDQDPDEADLSQASSLFVLMPMRLNEE